MLYGSWCHSLTVNNATNELFLQTFFHYISYVAVDRCGVLCFHSCCLDNMVDMQKMFFKLKLIKIIEDPPLISLG